MAVAKWFGVLSTTEPRNDVGIIKVRQGNVNSEIAEFQIIQNNKPYDLTGLTVYFCASFGLNLVEKPAVVVNTTGGKIQYTFDGDSMQSVGRQKGYFSIKKEESKIDSTQEFEFQVESSLMTRSIDGKSYIYKLSVLIKLLEDYSANGQENFDVWFESVKEILYGVDPGGNILKELIEARTTETGQTFNTLKARLNSFDAQFAQNDEELTSARDGEMLLNERLNRDFMQININVKALGAKGDGISDDTGIIQYALDTYGSAYLPKGTYAVSKLVIPDKSKLYGVDKVQSIIKCIDETNATEIIEIPRSSSYTTLTEFTLKGNKYKKADGVSYTSTGEIIAQDSRHRINKVNIEECRNSLKMDWRSRGMIVEDIYSIQCALKGFTIEGSDNVISNCVSSVSGTDGFYITGDNNRISNIKALYAGQNKFNGSGVKLNGCNNSTFTNLDIQENVFDNIYLNNCSSIIMQNVISDGAGCLYKRGQGLDFYDADFADRVPIANIKLNDVRGLILDAVVINRGILSTGDAWWQSQGGFISLSSKRDNNCDIRLTIKDATTDGLFKNAILKNLITEIGNETMLNYQTRNRIFINGKLPV